VLTRLESFRSRCLPSLSTDSTQTVLFHLHSVGTVDSGRPLFRCQVTENGPSSSSFFSVRHSLSHFRPFNWYLRPDPSPVRPVRPGVWDEKYERHGQPTSQKKSSISASHHTMHTLKILTSVAILISPILAQTDITQLLTQIPACTVSFSHCSPHHLLMSLSAHMW
jgi:hypothetical protein